MTEITETQKRKRQNPTSNGSGELPSLPDTDFSAPGLWSNDWKNGASRDLIRAVVVRIAYLMEPDMSGVRVQALVADLSAQSYSRGAILFANEKLPRSRYLDEKIRYGGRLTPADFDRVIRWGRSLRTDVSGDLTREQMEAILEIEPDLSREDFGDRPDDMFVLDADARSRLQTDSSV